MNYRMTRSEFDQRLQSEKYTLAELSHLFKVFLEMDRRVRSWTMRWLLGKGFPQDVIEDVSVPMLVEAGYKPMNAFIIMDWLLKDPVAAKYSLRRHVDTLIFEEEPDAALTKEETREEESGPDEVEADC